MSRSERGTKEAILLGTRLADRIVGPIESDSSNDRVETATSAMAGGELSSPRQTVSCALAEQVQLTRERVKMSSLDDRLTSGSVCEYCVASLRLFATTIEDGLHDEFCFNEEVIRDWATSLELLRDAGELLSARIRTSDLPANLKQESASRLKSFHNEISAAIACVQAKHQKPRPPADRIFEALSSVSGARYDLSRWQEELAASSQEAVLVDVTREVVETVHTKLANAFNDLQKMLIEGDDYHRCMASRRLYQVTYYTAVVCPILWTKDVHEKIIRLHENVLGCMTRGRAYDSVKKRLGMLLALTPTEYPNRVLNVQDNKVD